MTTAWWSCGEGTSPKSWSKAKSVRPTRRASGNSSPRACLDWTCTKCASRWQKPASSMSMSRSPIDGNALAHLARRPSGHGGIEEWFDQIGPGRIRFRRLFPNPQGFQTDGARSRLRRLGNGDRHLFDGKELRQTDGAAAGCGDGAFSARLRIL